MSEKNENSVDALVQIVKEGEATVFGLVEHLEGGKTLTVERRVLQPEQPPALEKQEALRVDHEFHDVEGLLDYVGKYGTHGDVVFFANLQSKKVVVALGEQKTEGGGDFVTFAPAIHPRWQPWHRALSGGCISLEAFRDLVRNNRKAVVGGRDLVMLLRQVDIKQDIRVQKGKGNHALNTVVCKVSVTSGGATTEETVEFPDEIRLNLPIFVGSDPIEIAMDMTFELKNPGEKNSWIAVELAAADVNDATNRAFESAMETIKTAIEVEDRVGRVGLQDATFTYGDPDYKSKLFKPRAISQATLR